MPGQSHNAGDGVERGGGRPVQQMKAMNNNKYTDQQLEQLAALLDGEISNEQELAALRQRLDDDPALKAEFDGQRQVKSALGSLLEYSAPDFMATRTMGEISQRRRQTQRRLRWRPWLAAAGGFAACLVLVLAALPMLNTNTAQQLPASQPMMAGNTATQPATNLARSMDNEFFNANSSWSRELPVSDEKLDELDPQLREFLEFVNEAHGYRVMVRQGDQMSPDFPAAVLVFDEGAGE